MIKIESVNLDSGKGRVILNTEKDECLYKAPVNPPNTGTKYTRGSDLYVHRSKKGNLYFYFYRWSLWQGEEDSIQLISHKDTEEFLQEHIGGTWGLTLTEAEEIEKKYGFNLTEETA